MSSFKIKGDDEFTFKAMVNSYGDDGQPHLTINYKKEYNNELVVTIEAYSNKDNMVGFETITYRRFKRLYPKHRIYLQGFIKEE